MKTTSANSPRTRIVLDVSLAIVIALPKIFQLEKQIEGRRYIELSDPDKPGEGGWRLTGELHLGKDQRYQLSAH